MKMLNYTKTIFTSGCLLLTLTGCVSNVAPVSGSVDGASGRGYASVSAEVPDSLLNYAGDAEDAFEEEDLVANAVRDAGRRLGATTGYSRQAEFLYQSVADYDKYLSQIFDFDELMLPEGVVPPVLARADDTISFKREQGKETKEIRAQVLKTMRNARFANSGGPHWRDYLRLTSPAQEKPLPQFQEEIDKHRGAWKRGVKEGYQKGVEQASRAFDIAINELSRDYAGMQLFRMLWLGGQVEAPRIVDQSRNVVGGGRGNDEMSIGVRRVVISEPVYFVNDASQWTALIKAAMDSADKKRAGLSDVVNRVDNTQHPKGMMDVPNLSDVR